MDRLARYAELAVRIGANVQPGQTLFVFAQPEHMPLARAVVEAAWLAGAGDVQVVYRDEHVRRLHALHAPDGLLDRTPDWQETAARATDGAALVHVTGDPDPDLFADVDELRAARAEPRRLREIGIELGARRATAWTVIVQPTEGWARAVFGEPDVARLWDELAAVVRLDAPDPVAAWREHVEKLDRRARSLDELGLRAIRFRGPDTDLHVGLIDGARWRTARLETSWGQEHVINLPTEEVFTSPDRRLTEGTVRLTGPLYWSGSVVEDATLRFASGRVVEAHARVGESFLRSKLAEDHGASALGEVALVDVDSAVGRRGLLFKNGLVDENASSHIALGGAYTEPVEGAAEMIPEQRLALGLNESVIHVDVMIGGSEVDVDGTTTAGSAIPILRQGHWVLD